MRWERAALLECQRQRAGGGYSDSHAYVVSHEFARRVEAATRSYLTLALHSELNGMWLGGRLPSPCLARNHAETFPSLATLWLTRRPARRSRSSWGAAKGGASTRGPTIRPGPARRTRACLMTFSASAAGRRAPRTPLARASARCSALHGPGAGVPLGRSCTTTASRCACGELAGRLQGL